MDPFSVLAALTGLVGAGASMFGGGSEGEQKSSYTPQAQQGLDQALQSLSKLRSGADIREAQPYQQGMEYFQNLFNDPKFFQAFEAPLLRQFNEQIAPGLANQYAGMGSGGSLGSTGFRNQLAREAGNLSTNIAGLRGGMQAQAIPQMLQYAQQPVSNYASLLGTATQPTMNQYQPPSSGGLASIMSALSGAFGAGINSFGGSPGLQTSTQPSLAPLYDQQFRQTGVF